MIPTWRSLAYLAAIAALSGCAGTATGSGTAAGNQIVVRLDPSIPTVAAATIVAERDCAARGGQAYLLSPSTAQSAGPRPASLTFACDPIRRQSFGGNDARS